jgi:hypothetical protein
MALPKTLDYVTHLKKLKKDLINSTSPPINKKFKKMEQTYYPTKNQLRLLDLCGYKGYNKPPTFNYSTEVNQFIDD